MRVIRAILILIDFTELFIGWRPLVCSQKLSAALSTGNSLTILGVTSRVNLGLAVGQG